MHIFAEFIEYLSEFQEFIQSSLSLSLFDCELIIYYCGKGIYKPHNTKLTHTQTHTNTHSKSQRFFLG